MHVISRVISKISGLAGMLGTFTLPEKKEDEKKDEKSFHSYFLSAVNQNYT